MSGNFRLWEVAVCALYPEAVQIKARLIVHFTCDAKMKGEFFEEERAFATWFK
jgi:hypothetical protein